MRDPMTGGQFALLAAQLAYTFFLLWFASKAADEKRWGAVVMFSGLFLVMLGLLLARVITYG